MKHILAPIDFSADSGNVIGTAALLAKAHDALVTVLHVVAGPNEWRNLDDSAKEANPGVKEKVSEALQELENLKRGGDLRRVRTRLAVEVGSPVQQIDRYASTQKVDLIIVGTHGDGESKQYIGSTAQRVIRTAACPVLSIKKSYKPKRLSRIVVPLDLRTDPTAALKRIANLAAPFNAAIDLVFINTPEAFVDTETAQKTMSAYRRSIRKVPVNSTIYNDLEKERGILRFAAGDDLIALASNHNRQHSPGYNMGVTETVLFHSHQPVWSMQL
jgi:nucleotide-binding universal stress UspA family protein